MTLVVELNQKGVPKQMQDFAMIKDHISGQDKGKYTLKQLFAKYWPYFKRQRYYGRWFKRALERGLIEGIRLSRKRSDKSWEYEVI
jgi:hypothetical protein